MTHSEPHYTSCPICSSAHYYQVIERLVFEEYRIRIVQCRDCGLLYTNPVPSNEDIEAFVFEKYYRTKHVGSNIDKRFIRHFIRRARSHIKLISTYYPNEYKGKALDVGCGAGFFLKELRNLGWEVHGIEPDGMCYEYAVNVLGLDVCRGLFEDYSSGDRFDLVYFSHTFDDLINIGDVLETVKGLLRNKGKVFIEVPNYDRDKEFKYVKEGDFLENKYYFTPHTLRQLLEGNGFKILQLRTREPIFLNTLWQYGVSPYYAMRQIVLPENKKSHIQVVATAV